MYFLYKITDTLNDKIYIGQSIKERERWRQHKYFARQESPVQYLHRAMKKYGIEHFIYEVIATCQTQEDADETESQLIKQYDSRNKDQGYNRSPGGNVAWQSGLSSEMYPMFGKHHSEESKKMISKNNMGKRIPKTDEWKNKMSVIMTGRPLTEEWKEKLSISNTGKIRSQETRKNISLAKTGKTHDDQTKKKMSESHKKFSIEDEIVICQLFNNGTSVKHIITIYGCSDKTVYNILKRRQ